MARHSEQCHELRNSVRLKDGESAGIRAVLWCKQDVSHLLDDRRFKRIDLRGNLRVEDTLAPIAAADITSVPQGYGRVSAVQSLQGCLCCLIQSHRIDSVYETVGQPRFPGQGQRSIANRHDVGGGGDVYNISAATVILIVRTRLARVLPATVSFGQD